MTQVEKLDENLLPNLHDWIPIQSPGQKTKKVKLGNLVDTTALQSEIDQKADINHSHTEFSNLQQQINTKASQSEVEAKANSSDVTNALTTKVDTTTLANTVSVLQGEIAGKSPQGHTHQISDITGLLEKLSFQWTRKNSDGELIYKTLVDTQNNDVILSIPSGVSTNQEFEIKKIFAANYCKINGISKINGYSLQQGDILFFDDSTTQASTTKLIYIDNTVGWLSFPFTAFNTIKPLSLPTNKLKQLLYAGNLNLNNGDGITTWTDTVSGLNATQPNNSSRTTFKTNSFANNTIPGVQFSSSKFFSTFDLSWILNKYFTICVVEKRTAQSAGMLFGKAITDCLTFGADNNANIYYFTKFPASRVGVSVGSYSNPVVRIWTMSCNSREWSLWLNGTKQTQRAMQQITAYSTATLGLNDPAGYAGEMCLIAGYEGDMTDAEIKAISDAANQTFKTY